MIARRPIGILLLLLSLSGPASATDPLEALLQAYPDALAGFDGENLIWRDGTRMPLGPAHPNRSLAAVMRNGSILDQFRFSYPRDMPPLPPTGDAGRIRNRAFFDKMYGDCRAGDVVPKLVPVLWLPHSWGHIIRITSVNHIDRQLEAVSRQLDRLPAADKKYLYPIGGTYNCRDVAGTGETSMHGWGAAIDINVAYADYWRWHAADADQPPPYENRIPPDIVAIFEQRGFIWGGRWRHFDTMHFEYRPELLGEAPSSDN